MRPARARLLAVLAWLVTPACDEPPLQFDSGLYAACYDGAGLCIGPELVDESQRGLLDRNRCVAPLVCIPRKLIRGELAQPCSSIAGAEGRCLLDRLSLVAAQRERLPISSCEDSERCVPCFDPFTARATGACTLPGDPGPQRPPIVFGSCCTGAGRCLPAGMLDTEQRAQLARDSCAPEELCVPQFVVDEEPAVACNSVNATEGRCLPTCLPAIAAQAERLPSSTCASGQRCAPCFDPLSGEATGSCALAGDPGPLLPAHTFETCCGGAGRCLPSDLVDVDQRSALGQRECPADRLCAPQGLIDAQAPEACRSVGSREGRCLSECLPLVEQQLDRLPRASCTDGERCVPCFDPFNGAATGACSLPSDRGPVEPAAPFAECCQSSSLCLPAELVPGDARAMLDRADCSRGELCVPRVLSAGQAPASCNSIGGGEGRCLSRCVPMIAAQAAQLPRSTCADNERCAPCFDPFSGAATGSCALPGDPGPTRPAFTFGNCCATDGSSHGRCVPPDLVPEDKRSLLAAAGCSGSALCLPDTLLPPARMLPSCQSDTTRASGACVPGCLLDEATRPLTTPSTCSAWERCVPCAVLGRPTGVCDQLMGAVE